MNIIQVFKVNAKVDLVFLVLILLAVLVGCSKDEVVRVGIPFNNDGNEGVEFHSDILDAESIAVLRKIITDERTIEEPKDLRKAGDIYVSLDRPKEGTTEIHRYVWYQDDGSSILYNEGSDTYSALTETQTTELKKIVNNGN